MIQKHNNEMKKLQLKMNELETQVKIVDENLYLFTIFSLSVQNVKKSILVLKNRKTGSIVSYFSTNF